MRLPKLDPYFFFDGNCTEAMQAYQRTIGGRIEAMLTDRYGTSWMIGGATKPAAAA